MNSQRVWIYCRVGGGDEIALIFQKERLMAYAGECGFTAIHVCSDIASGLSHERPGFKELTAAVDDRKVDVILVYDVVRLHRSPMNLIPFLLRLREGNVQVLTLQEGYVDIDELSGTFLNLLRAVK